MASKPRKKCEACDEQFERDPRYSHKQWDEKRFCSIKCAWAKFVKHGQSHTRLFRVWVGIKNRCFNPNEPQFVHYGARGIVMAEEWVNDFAAFAQHVGPDPGNKFDIGRIDNDAGYVPGNIRWETRSQNTRNRRSTFWVEINGRRMSLKEACERRNVPYKKAWRRLKNGWSLERALSP